MQTHSPKYPKAPYIKVSLPCKKSKSTASPIKALGLVLAVLRLMIRFYQKAISPLTPPSCRFYPTCSAYTLEAIKRHGWYGVYLGAKRICKCHPWGAYGVDFVPLIRWNKVKFTPLQHKHPMNGLYCPIDATLFD